MNIMENKSNLETLIGLAAIAVLVFLMVILPAMLAYTAEGLAASLITGVFYSVFWGAILIPLGLQK